MSDIAVGSGAASNPIIDELNKAQKEADTAAAKVKELLDKLNAAGLKDDAGRVLRFDTMEGWSKAWEANRNWKDASGHLMSMDELVALRDPYDKAVKSCVEAQKALASAAEAAAASKALQDIINSGDIESALMMLNTNRVKLLDTQLQARMGQMKDRNDKITALNAELEKVQKTWGDGNEKNAEITRINGLLTGLNNDSQLDMIGMQQVVNKRNEAADLMTNLLGKFQKTIDGIVGNFR